MLFEIVIAIVAIASLYLAVTQLKPMVPQLALPSMGDIKITLPEFTFPEIGGIVEPVKDVIDTTKEGIGTITDTTKGLINEVTEAVGDVREGLETVKDTVVSITEPVVNVAKVTNTLVKDPVKCIAKGYQVMGESIIKSSIYTVKSVADFFGNLLDPSKPVSIPKPVTPLPYYYKPFP